MNDVQKKLAQRDLRKRRIRAKVIGTTERPRLTVFISNKHITAQIIDDSAKKTIVYVSTAGSKVEGNTMTERAAWVGAQIGKKAITAKVKQVVFDRGGHIYHGRVKALADKAREAGLEF